MNSKNDSSVEYAVYKSVVKKKDVLKKLTIRNHLNKQLYMTSISKDPSF